MSQKLESARFLLYFLSQIKAASWRVFHHTSCPACTTLPSADPDEFVTPRGHALRFQLLPIGLAARAHRRMADVNERAKVSPPSKRRRVNDDDDAKSSPLVTPNGTDAKPTNGSTPVKADDNLQPLKIKEEHFSSSARAKTEADVMGKSAAEPPNAEDKAAPPADSDPLKSNDVNQQEATPYNGAPVDAEARVPRHATVPAKDAYQPAPVPPPVPAPAPIGEYTYVPPTNTQPDVPRMPSGLTPDVDAVLERIFLSGLFERKDIDGRALDFLGSVAPSLAMAALEDIQHRDFSTVRNKPAFIMSIFKRVVASGGAPMPPQQPPPGGYPPTSVPASALAHLPPGVSDALQRVFASGVCHPSQFDDRAMDILVDLHESDAVRALSEFAAMEPGRVRNPSAFWMGLARKYKGQARRDPSMPASYGGNDGYGTYDRMSTGYGAVDQRIQELISMGGLPPNPFDDRALDALRRLPEQDALSVLGELPEPSRVRNMSAYVMGLCKKFASGEARSLVARAPYAVSGAAYGAGGGGSGGGGAGGGGYDYGGGYGSAYGAYGGAYAAPAVEAERSGGEVRRAFDSMDSSVRERFYRMVSQGLFVETAFDHRAIGALQTMHRDEACAALDELAASDPGRIHNISAYFMGLAKKFGRSL